MSFQFYNSCFSHHLLAGEFYIGVPHIAKTTFHRIWPLQINLPSASWWCWPYRMTHISCNVTCVCHNCNTDYFHCSAFSTDIIPRNIALATDRIKPYNVMPVYGKSLYSYTPWYTYMVNVPSTVHDHIKSYSLTHIHSKCCWSYCNGLVTLYSVFIVVHMVIYWVLVHCPSFMQFSESLILQCLWLYTVLIVLQMISVSN